MAGTNWTAITTFEQLLSQANNYSPFWTGVLFMIWIVLIIMFIPYGTVTAVLGGSFLAILMGIFLLYMGLVAWKWVLAIFAVMVLVLIWEALFAKKE